MACRSAMVYFGGIGLKHMGTSSTRSRYFWSLRLSAATSCISLFCIKYERQSVDCQMAGSFEGMIPSQCPE